MHPVSKEALGELGVLAAGADEIAQRAEDATAEPVAGGEKRRGRGCQADAVALELLERVAARGHLGLRFLRPSAVGAVHRLLFARLRHQVTGVVRLLGRALGLVAQEAGPLNRMVAPAFGSGQLSLKSRPVRLRAGRSLPQRCQLALECGALAFQRAERLRVGLELLLPLAYLRALLAQTPAHVFLGRRPAGELAPNALVLDRGGVAIAGGRVALHQGLLRAVLHDRALLMGPEAPRGGVGQTFGSQGQVTIQLAELDSNRAEPAADLRAPRLRGGPGVGRLLPTLFSVREPAADRGEQIGQLPETGLHPRRLLGQAVEQSAGEGDLDREFLLDQLGMALGLAALASQAPDL